MKIHVGTSGFGYKEWKGSFYPEKISPGEMLAFYSRRFTTVEINNTFYRMPNASVMAAWAAQVPRGFRFAVKAPQVITHIKRLHNVKEEARLLLRILSVLGPKLGPVLFQFPGSFRQDLPLLQDFLGLIPPKTACAFDFRSASWSNSGTYDLLRERGFCLCQEDTDETPVEEIVSTAGWGYFRLRRVDYDETSLAQWAKKILSQKWKQAFVFFKHEEDGAARGPELAASFRKLVE